MRKQVERVILWNRFRKNKHEKKKKAIIIIQENILNIPTIH